MLSRRSFMNRVLLSGGVAAVAVMAGACGSDGGSASSSPSSAAGGPPSGRPGGGPGGGTPVTYADFKGITTDGTVVEDLYSVHSTGVSTDEVRAEATAFLAALSADQKAETLFDVEADEWFKWSNVHAYERAGVSLADLSDVQKTAGFALLQAGLSARGLKQTRNIIRLNQVAGELIKQTDQFNEEAYYFTVMGTPSATAPWGFQFEGHHLAINYFVLGDQVVMTPTFMGTEPASGTYNGEEIVLFTDETQAGLAMINSLTSAQQEKAIVSSSKTGDNEKSAAFQDNAQIPYQGVQGSTLAAAQQQKLLDLIEVYVGNIDDGHAKVKMKEVAAHLDDTYFSWAGATDDDAVFYYRVHSPVILIEYDAQQPGPLAASYGAAQGGALTRNHIHTVVRTPNGNDYGMDLLRQHLETGHS
jgi:hypothetical protein